MLRVCVESLAIDLAADGMKGRKKGLPSKEIWWFTMNVTYHNEIHHECLQLDRLWPIMKCIDNGMFTPQLDCHPVIGLDQLREL